MTPDNLTIGPVEQIPLPAPQRKTTVAVENALLELKPNESRTLPARYSSTAKTAAKKLGFKITIRPAGDDIIRVFRKA